MLCCLKAYKLVEKIKQFCKHSVLKIYFDSVLLKKKNFLKNFSHSLFIYFLIPSRVWEH